MQLAAVEAAEARAAWVDGRQARFADRIVELAGRLIAASVNVRVDVKPQIEFRRQHPTDRSLVVGRSRNVSGVRRLRRAA
jgi:hypothetical protein